MKKIKISDATASLADFARQATEEPLIVMDRSKPVAMIVGLGDADWETVSLSLNPKFWAIIERSGRSIEREGAIPAAEVRRRLGLKPKAQAAPKARGTKRA